jgi:hypothetical protein
MHYDVMRVVERMTVKRMRRKEGRGRRWRKTFPCPV